MYFHGGKGEKHHGICITDSKASALAYASENGGQLFAVEIDFSGLGLVECPEYDRNTDDAPGDDPCVDYWIDEDAGIVADVLVFRDEDHRGRAHQTWRLMTREALEAAVFTAAE